MLYISVIYRAYELSCRRCESSLNILLSVLHYYSCICACVSVCIVLHHNNVYDIISLIFQESLGNFPPYVSLYCC